MGEKTHDPIVKQALEAKLRASWAFKIEQATRGNNTKAGAIVLAFLRRRPHGPPAIGNRAAISKIGRIFADFLDKDGVYHPARDICSVVELTDMLRKLADHCKLSDNDRLEMQAEVKKWIVKDYRAQSNEADFDARTTRARP